MKEPKDVAQQLEAVQPALAEHQGELGAFSRHVHSYINEYIKLADQKAAFIFTIGAGLLAFLNQTKATRLWLKPLGSWSLVEVLAFLSLISLGIGVILAVGVVVPNLRSGAGHGYIFWESIVEFKSSSNYAEEIKKSDQSPNLSKAILEHCYALARVCKRKYRTLKLSILFSAVGVCITVILLIFVP